MALFNPEAIAKLTTLPTTTDVLIARKGKGIPEKVSLQAFTKYLPVLWTIDFMDFLTMDIYAPYNLQVVSITAIVNAPTVTVLVNDVAYVEGQTVVKGSKVTLTVDANSVINVNIEVI